MAITRKLLDEVERLKREIMVGDYYQSLTEYTDKTNINYKFLRKGYLEQRYDTNDKLVAGYKGVVLEGSSRCFYAAQSVVTKNGSKPISEVKKGDEVASFNITTKETEFKKVKNVWSSPNNKKSYKITLRNGEVIKCTQDHKFYYKGKFIEISKIHEHFKKLQ